MGDISSRFQVPGSCATLSFFSTTPSILIITWDVDDDDRYLEPFSRLEFLSFLCVRGVCFIERIRCPVTKIFVPAGKWLTKNQISCLMMYVIYLFTYTMTMKDLCFKCFVTILFDGKNAMTHA